MANLIKHTLKVIFSIEDHTRQLRKNNLSNIYTTFLLFIDFFYQRNRQNLDQKVNQQQNTVQPREFYTNAVGDVGDI